MPDDTHGARHGAETYFVEGEGILGGNIDDESARPLASAAAAGTPAFHFSRMGPKGTGKQLGRPLRVKLGEKMAAGGGGESQIPAGFTYLGQFIDHDLTFDNTTVTLGDNVTPADLLQGRSPSLDLDSLYGAGPQRPRVGEVLRGRRHPPRRWARRWRPTGSRPWTASTCRAVRQRRGGEAHGDHPRHAQRREPRGRPDAPRDDPLPQPGRRHAPGLGAGRAALRRRRASWSPSTTSGWSAPTTCRGSATRRWSTTCSPTAARRSRSARRRPTCRRCRSSSRWPRSGSGTPWSARAYNWNMIFDNGGGHARPAVPVLRAPAVTWAASRGCPSNWIADLRRLYDFKRGRQRSSPCRRRVQPRDAHRHALVNPLRPAHGLLRRPAVPFDDRRQPRVPQPRPGPGWSSWPPASRWRRSCRARASTLTAADRRRRSATATAASSSTGSPAAQLTRCSRTRRCGSTSCARPSSTAAG